MEARDPSTRQENPGDSLKCRRPLLPGHMHACMPTPSPLAGWPADGWIGFIQIQQKSAFRSGAAVNWPARSIVSYRCRCRQLFPGPFHASSCSAAFVCLFVVLLLSAGCSVAAVHLPPVMRCRAGAAACKTKLTPFTGRSAVDGTGSHPGQAASADDEGQTNTHTHTKQW